MAFVVAALALTGCKPNPATTVAAPSPSMTPTVTASPSTSPGPRVVRENEPPGPGIVATGALTSGDGKTTGEFTVESFGGGKATLTITGFRTSHSSASVLLSAWPRPHDPCADGGSEVFSELRAKDQRVIAFDLDAATDWTYWSEVDVTIAADPKNPVSSKQGLECQNVIVARGELKWSISPMRWWLAALKDSGPGPGAMGAVRKDGDGRVTTYVVAADDRMPEIAARFGIARSELEYLNPTRTTPGSDDLAIGQLLNLDLMQRGRQLDPSLL